MSTNEELKSFYHKILSLLLAVAIIITNIAPLLTITSYAETFNQDNEESYLSGSYASLVHSPTILGNGLYQQVEWIKNDGNAYIKLADQYKITEYTFNGKGKGVFVTQSLANAYNNAVWDHENSSGSTDYYYFTSAIAGLRRNLYAPDSTTICSNFAEYWIIKNDLGHINNTHSLSEYKIRNGLQSASVPMWQDNTEFTSASPFTYSQDYSDAEFNGSNVYPENVTFTISYREIDEIDSHNDEDEYPNINKTGQMLLNPATKIPVHTDKYGHHRDDADSHEQEGDIYTSEMHIKAPIYLMAGYGDISGSTFTVGTSYLFGFTYTTVDGVNHDIVPCYRNSDKVMGVYDKATNTFYSNASSSGSFTVGPNVGTPTKPVVTVTDSYIGYLHQSDLLVPIESYAECGYITYTWYMKYKDQFNNWTDNWVKLTTDAEKDKYYLPTELQYDGTTKYIKEFKYKVLVKSSVGLGTSSELNATTESAEFLVTLNDGIHVDFMTDENNLYKRVYGPLDGTVTPLSTATKTGYSFVDYWYTDTTFTTSNTDWTGAVDTVYAKWEPGEYTITYHLNGTGVNNAKNKDTHTYGTSTTLYNPTWTGRIFKGWYTDELLENKVTSLGATSYTANIDLYAKWEKASYTIVYNLNGGNNDSRNPDTYSWETGVDTLYPATKTDYTFGGWFLDRNFKGTSVSSLTEETYEETINLWAKWIAPNYDIVYHLNGGSNNTSNVDTYSYENGVSLYEPTKTGHDFDGWYTDTDCQVGKVTSLSAKKYTSTIDLYAKWTPHVYSVSYYLNGGTNDSRNPSTHTYGTDTDIYPATKTDYIFKGWYTDKNFAGTPITKLGATEFSEDPIKVYAYFKSADANVTVKYMGKKINSVSEYEVISTQEFNSPTDSVVTANILTFDGFTYAPSVRSDEKTGTVAEDGSLTLYVYYNRNEYTITFNSGTGESKSYDYEYGETIVAPEFERKNYTFDEWSPSVPSTMPANDLSVTATWTKNSTSSVKSSSSVLSSSSGTYKIKSNVPEEYHMNLSRETAPSGYTITINFNPESGYTIGEVMVATRLQEIPVTFVRANCYEFTMPNSEVEISLKEKETVAATLENPSGDVEQVSIGMQEISELSDPLPTERKGYTSQVDYKTRAVKTVVGLASTTLGFFIGNTLAGSLSNRKYRF